jgi:hypothetical protein
MPVPEERVTGEAVHAACLSPYDRIPFGRRMQNLPPAPSGLGTPQLYQGCLQLRQQHTLAAKHRHAHAVVLLDFLSLNRQAAAVLVWRGGRIYPVPV